MHSCLLFSFGSGLVQLLFSFVWPDVYTHRTIIHVFATGIALTNGVHSPFLGWKELGGIPNILNVCSLVFLGFSGFVWVSLGVHEPPWLAPP